MLAMAIRAIRVLGVRPREDRFVGFGELGGGVTFEAGSVDLRLDIHEVGRD